MTTESVIVNDAGDHFFHSFHQYANACFRLRSRGFGTIATPKRRSQKLLWTHRSRRALCNIVRTGVIDQIVGGMNCVVQNSAG
jgi:hypothetical protein